MQLAKQGFQLSLVAALLASASNSFALLPPQPTASAPAVEAAKPLTAAAVQAVAIGKATNVEAGTLRELEVLQRQTALAEARKKLNELQGTSSLPTATSPSTAPTGNPAPLQAMAPAAVSQAVGKPTSAGRQKLGMFPAASSPTAPAMPLSEFVAPPIERVLKLIVVGTRSRADLVSSGKVTTVKVGDKLGRWTVSEINADGVTVERRLITFPIQMTPTLAEAASSPAAAGLPGAKEYDYVKLQKANEYDIMGTQPLAVVQRPAGVVVPPLPQAVKPDSSYVPPGMPALPPPSTAP